MNYDFGTWCGYDFIVTAHDCGRRGTSVNHGDWCLAPLPRRGKSGGAGQLKKGLKNVADRDHAYELILFHHGRSADLQVEQQLRRLF
jgi:hypothetical protein